MALTLAPQVAAVLAAATERSGPPPAPPVGDVADRRTAARTGASMHSLEYRLGPGDPHPTPVADASAGLTWLSGHADELDIGPARIALMGDSAAAGSPLAPPS